MSPNNKLTKNWRPSDTFIGALYGAIIGVILVSLVFLWIHDPNRCAEIIQKNQLFEKYKLTLKKCRLK